MKLSYIGFNYDVEGNIM